MLFVGGYPRFQYDGYWVTFIDPWPETWPPNWYETDDVYLDYTGDGYYIYDRNVPGHRDRSHYLVLARWKGIKHLGFLVLCSENRVLQVDER